MPAVATPSMSEGLRRAAARAFRAASAFRPMTDRSGTLPSLVVSAAPTTAMDFCFIGSALHWSEQGQGDVVGLPGEGDLDRHIELQRLGRLRAIHNVGHHGRALLQLHDGDRMRFSAHIGARTMVDDVGPKHALAAHLVGLDIARSALRAKGERREVTLLARPATLEAQLAYIASVPEVTGLWCGFW